MRTAEEQRPLEPVGDDLLVEQGALLGGVVVAPALGRAASRDPSTSASVSSRSAVVFASWRRASAPAVTMPSTTAVARSSTTVARKVRASTKASLREARTRARRLDTSTIRTAVAMSTPASAASGIHPTTGREGQHHDAAARASARPRPAGTAPRSGTFTAVRAIAAVAGMPPSSGDARLARPCPNSSRSGSWRVDTLIASATVADSRLSSAARAATATAGATSTRSSLHVTDGTVSVNSCEGSAPMVATGRWATRVDDGGRHDGQQGHRHGGAPAGSRAGSARRRRRSGPGRRGRGPRTSRPPPRPRPRRRGRVAPVTPRAEGTCWRAIRAAMPSVNPSMTGNGMKRT